MCTTNTLRCGLFTQVDTDVSVPCFSFLSPPFYLCCRCWEGCDHQQQHHQPLWPPTTLVWALSMRMKQLSNTMPRNKFGNVTLPENVYKNSNLQTILGYRWRYASLQKGSNSYVTSMKRSHIFTCKEILYWNLSFLKKFCFLCFFVTNIHSIQQLLTPHEHRPAFMFIITVELQVEF